MSDSPPPPETPNEPLPSSGQGPESAPVLLAETPARPADDDPTFRQTILHALRAGPLTGYGVARAVDRLSPGFLRQREGYVYPALLDLWRRGEIEPHWADLDVGRRRVYALRRGGGWAPTAGVELGPPTSPRPASEALRKLTRACVRGLSFAPHLRDAIEREILDHLLDAAADARQFGLSAEEADERALRDFGDGWKVRTDLRRTARGHRTVLFPRGLRDLLTHVWIYEVRILLFIVAAILFVRVQVVTAYHIPTRSMEPTLHGDPQDGDRILVNRMAGAPERFDIVVFDGWGAERKNYVKRCAGLPGEAIKIREGDLYIDGQLVRKEGAILEALLFPLYDIDDIFTRARDEHPDDRAAVSAEVVDGLFDLWKSPGGKWDLQASRGFRGERPDGDGEDFGEAVLRWDDTVHDDIYEPATGDVDSGGYAVPDVRVTARIEPESYDTRVSIRLTRGAATYEAVLRGDEPGVAIVVDGETVAHDPSLEVLPGKVTPVRFSQVDRVIRLEVDGKLLRHELPQLQFPKRAAPAGELTFRVQSDVCWIRPMRLERDIFWTPDYDDDEVQLGPDEYFMLGDNSGNSEDSRRRGPVHASRIVGKPLLVVWPPRRIHRPR